MNFNFIVVDIKFTLLKNFDLSFLEPGKRTLERLGTDYLVSLAKRKEQASRDCSKIKIGQNKNKYSSIQEFGESISTEADSGFETLGSITTDSIANDVSGANDYLSTVEAKQSPPRRSPRFVKEPQIKDDLEQSSPSNHLSISLNNIQETTNQILTRSRSLRLSGEPSYLPSSAEKQRGSYHPSSDELEKASTSLISKFNSSLLGNERCSIISTQSDERVTPTSFVDNIADNENGLKIQPLKFSAQTASSESKLFSNQRFLHRDISTCGYGRHRHVKTRANKIHANSARIVYSPGVFHGRERLDIVRRLNDMSASHILDDIWSCLSAQELGRALQVSFLKL